MGIFVFPNAAFLYLDLLLIGVALIGLALSLAPRQRKKKPDQADLQ